MSKILIGVNLFGKYHRQDVAIDSWKHLQTQHPNKIEFQAIQFESEKSGFVDQGIDPKFVLTRSSKNIVQGGTKELPILRDMLEYLYNQVKDDLDYTHFGWMNSDIIVTNVLVDYLQKNEVKALAASRLEIENVSSFGDILKNGIAKIREEIAGADLIILSKEWWEKYNHLIEPYCLSMPEFDQVLMGIIAVTGGEIYNNSNTPMICHIQHPIQWGTDSPEKQWNISLKKDHPFDHLCFNMMHYHLQYNLAKRKPWGAFLQPQPGEKEFTKEFFDIFSLETENRIRYVS